MAANRGGPRGGEHRDGEALSRTEFYAALDEILEAPSGTVRGSETLAELEGWDSLAVISFMAMVDERLGIGLALKNLEKCANVEDLVCLLGDAVSR